MRASRKTILLLSSFACAGLMTACSGSSSSGGSTSSGTPVGQMNLRSISLVNNSVMPLNRPIMMRFDRAIDFRTASSTSIQIQTSDGTSAMGIFGPLMVDTDGDGIRETADLNVIVWQPSCPMLPDFSDAGLSSRGESYTLRLRGTDSSGSNNPNGLEVLKGLDGRQLRTSEVRNFTTPNSMTPSVLFEDPISGTPVALVRRRGDTRQMGVSHVELGGNSDPNSRLYFERDNPLSMSVVVPGPAVTTGTTVPLNLYGDPRKSVAFKIEFNQPVNPSRQNMSNTRLRLEYLLPSPGSQWTPMDTEVTLVQNCSDAGAQVQLEPIGILPPDSQLRAVVKAGFEGLTGASDRTLVDQNLFAVVTTDLIFDGTLSDPTVVADQIFEGFDVGGSGSLQDIEADLSSPSADWGGGKLSSSINFPGNGGQNGTFDWVVLEPIELFDTSSQTIVGGPNGSRSLEQFTTGGVANVHDFIITAGSELRIAGPNPFVVNATGEIRIEGRLSIIGGNARDVATLNTGSQPEPGGTGNAGGGDGGSTSRIRNNSTPRGDNGFGPFGTGPTGGQGGESGAGIANNPIAPENRRPGGGGGGRFAADQNDSSATTEQAAGIPSRGMLATQGGPGHASSRGAVTNQIPAMGGLPGPGPFQDGRSDNDFFGEKLDVSVSIPMDGMPPVAGPVQGIIQGELSEIHAGYGGGGGGDSLPALSFPTPNWTVFSDEKGGGGGGGGGAIRMRALGPIRFVGLNSLLTCKGGNGANGENFIWVDRIGGTGGSGSGGHVILESATRISFELPPVAQRPAGNLRRTFIDARGFRGKIGQSTNQATGNNLINLPLDLSFGGDGGPGLIQLHVPDPITPPQESAAITDIVLPVGTEADLNAGDANALHEVMRPAGVQLLSTFGGRSSAQTRWVDLRRTELNPSGGKDLIRFLFLGIDPANGKVLSTNEIVNELDPILSGPLIAGLVDIQGADTLVIRASALQPLIDSVAPTSNDIYLRTPALLRGSLLRLTSALGIPLDFVIQSAVYNPAAVSLSVTVGMSAGVNLDGFVDPVNPPRYSLIPRFFGLSTGGVPNLLPLNSELRISFEGARSDLNGDPDTSSLLVPETSNVSALNMLMAGELEFIRFKFDLNVDAMASGVSIDTPSLELDFFRFPFLF